MDIIEDPQHDEFASRIPLNREFNELEKYCDPCSFKDGLPLYKYRPEFVQFMRNEVLDRVLSQRDFVVESPTSAVDLMPKQTRLSPPEWIEVFRPFIEKGYYVYRIENKLILTAKRVLNPLPLIENTYILEYYEGGEKSYRSYPLRTRIETTSRRKDEIQISRIPKETPPSPIDSKNLYI